MAFMPSTSFQVGITSDTFKPYISRSLVQIPQNTESSCRARHAAIQPIVSLPHRKSRGYSTTYCGMKRNCVIASKVHVGVLPSTAMPDTTVGISGLGSAAIRTADEQSCSASTTCTSMRRGNPFKYPPRVLQWGSGGPSGSARKRGSRDLTTMVRFAGRQIQVCAKQ